MKARLATITLTTSLALCGGVQADTLLIDKVDQPPAAEPVRPARGMTMEVVENRFGAPATAKPAVGDPPITTWEYAEFVVFFEHNRVIHAVEKSKFEKIG